VKRHDAVLISPGELKSRLAAGDCPAILDVRWRLDRPDGKADYLAGHLPGAVYVSLEQELSDHTCVGLGRHPLPSGAAIQAAARRWGIRKGQPVVVYDDWNRAGSARAWWVLTAAGLPDVRILDGGLQGWTTVGGELHTSPVRPPAGDVTVGYRDLYAGGRPTLTADQVANGGVTMVLLDARAPDRFRGEIEPLDPLAGHIPGAHNLPSVSLLDHDGTFLPEAALTGLPDGRGPESIGVYCGSGVTASVVLAALSAAGVDAALFPGSWSQWSGENRPAQRGP
jgi:thiosulfate/3-mercaptopyruvate sulfurtransferase